MANYVFFSCIETVVDWYMLHKLVYLIHDIILHEYQSICLAIRKISSTFLFDLYRHYKSTSKRRSNTAASAVYNYNVTKSILYSLSPWKLAKKYYEENKFTNEFLITRISGSTTLECLIRKINMLFFTCVCRNVFILWVYDFEWVYTEAISYLMHFFLYTLTLS